MKIGNIAKLLGLVGVIALVNIAVLSPGLLGIQIIGGSPLEAAMGATLIAASLMAFLYGSYSWLLRSPAPMPLKEAKTHEDFAQALAFYRDNKLLKKDIRLAMDQLERMVRRKSLLMKALGERFQETELSYRRFAGVVEEVEGLFYGNIRSILNKLAVFDPRELSDLSEQSFSRLSGSLAQQKKALREQYMNDVARYVGANEEILLKLDQLLLEMARLGGTYSGDIEDINGIQELNALIVQTKHYKQ